MGLINWNKIFRTYDDKIKEEAERKKKQYEDAKKNVSSFVKNIVSTYESGGYDKAIAKPKKFVEEQTQKGQDALRQTLDFLPIKSQYKDTIAKIINAPSEVTGKVIGAVLPNEADVAAARERVKQEELEQRRAMELNKKVGMKLPLTQEEEVFKQYRLEKQTKLGMMLAINISGVAPLSVPKLTAYGSGKVALEISRLENELDHLVPKAAQRVRGAVEYINEVAMRNVPKVKGGKALVGEELMGTAQTVGQDVYKKGLEKLIQNVKRSGSKVIDDIGNQIIKVGDDLLGKDWSSKVKPTIGGVIPVTPGVVQTAGEIIKGVIQPKGAKQLSPEAYLVENYPDELRKVQATGESLNLTDKQYQDFVKARVEDLKGVEVIPQTIKETTQVTQTKEVGGIPSIRETLKSFTPETIGRTIKDPEVVIKEAEALEKGTVGVKLSPEETKIKFSEAAAAKLLGRVADTSDMKAFNQVYEWMTRPVVQAHPEATIPEAIASRILSRGVEPVMEVFEDIAKGPQDRKTITKFWEETAKLPVKYSYMDIVMSHPTPAEIESGTLSAKLMEETISPLKPILPSPEKVLLDPGSVKTINERLDAIKTFKTYYDVKIQKLDNFMLTNGIDSSTLIKTREGTLDYVTPIMQKADKMLKDLLDELFNYLDIDPRYRKNYFPRIQYKDGGQLITIINKYTEVPFAKAMNLIHGNRLRRTGRKIFDPTIWSSDLPQVLRDYVERTAVYRYTYDTAFINKTLDYIKKNELDKVNLIDHFHEVADKEAAMAKATAKGDLDKLREAKEAAVSPEAKSMIQEDIKGIEDTYDSLGARTIFNPEFTVQDRHRGLLNPSLLLEKVGLIDLWRPVRDYKATAIALAKEWEPIIASGDKVNFIKAISKALDLQGEKRINFYNDALETIQRAAEKGQNMQETMTRIAQNVAQHQTFNKALVNIEKWIKTHDIPNNALRAFLEDQFKKVSFEGIQTKNIGDEILASTRKLLSRTYIGGKPRTAIRNWFEVGRVQAEYNVPTFLKAEAEAMKKGATENYSDRYGVNAEDTFKRGILNAVPKDVNVKTLGQLYERVMSTMDFKLNYKLFMIFEMHKNNVFLAASELWGREKLGLKDMDLQNYVLDQFNKLAIVPGAFTTPNVFQDNIIKTGFLFQQYNLQEWGITYEKGKQALAGDKQAMSYLAKILAWKTGQYALESVLWGADVMNVLGGKLGFGPIVSLFALGAAALADYLNNKDEEGYSFSDYTKDKLLTQGKALAISMTGLPGGLITQIEDAIQAQKEGGVFSPTGKLKFPNEVSQIREIMAMLFGIYSTPTARWIRERGELPLGEIDTNFFKNMITGGAEPKELRSLYITIMKARAYRSFQSMQGDIAKKQVQGKIDVNEAEKQRARARKILEDEIVELDRINEKGFKSLPF